MAGHCMLRGSKFIWPQIQRRGSHLVVSRVDSLVSSQSAVTGHIPLIVQSQSLSCLRSVQPAVLTRLDPWILEEAPRRWRYSDFGHKPQEISAIRKAFFWFMLGVVGLCTWHSGILNSDEEKEFDTLNTRTNAPVSVFPSVKAASLENESAAEGEEDGEEAVEGEEKKGKKKIGFRDRKIIGYEDRIRAYSTPDKIFRYFATLKVLQNGEWEVYMTPEDFVRSITPGIKQPEGLGLDSFRRFDPKQERKEMLEMVDPNSIFHRMGQSGLISFSDYIFLLTVLSTPPRNFELGFRMFDFNGDGEVDIDEFLKVQGVMRNQTSVGSKHRNHSNSGSVDHGMSSALNAYFFGKDGQKKLTVNFFLKFQEELHSEINRIEYNRHAEDGIMSEGDFGSALIAYAGLAEVKKTRMLKRVRRKYKEDPLGITFEEYQSVVRFLQNINDVDTALSFYHLAGVSIDQETFKHVAKTVAFVEMTNHVVDVIFTLFDEDNDGELSNKEFVSVMKRRVLRGLERPKDTGFVKLINAVVKCASSTHLYHE